MEDNILDTLENNNNQLPEDVQKKLSSMLEKYLQLTDEEKQDFQNGAMDVLLKSLNKNRISILPTWLAPYQSYILFMFAVSIVAFLLAIVARNLYRRAWDREQRQSEKKKRKEQKAAMKNKKKA
nr:PREDICTED: uncharacterized protein LOC105672700 [Linepithema humile]